MCTHIRLAVALVFLSVTLLVSFANGQAPVSQPGSQEKVIGATGPAQPSNSDNKVPPSSRTSELENDVAAMKADNAAVREQLRKMEETQKALLELVDRLQRRLDGNAVVAGGEAAPAAGPTEH